ncbi:16S rRNA (uracil(1498)-N(3))-methyltransferase [Roseibium sediminicola]|uniref:Ribosomal RNA small subunit methyltransferase E n=1 Tax=Roseibium sediminicola TaxID=2933272 RepID=A0ABT0GMI2_9HYPH|nr:16S rRNA (uracil(1498)-N(3))-methyltransferase [Roseibium sp. CAU 1639]MCK7610625.1 16S rRNA (uracil(1498)-N(3))-methyltransferase [Roseibium sp. CAU 1639]
MAKYEFNMQRLFLRHILADGARIEADRGQANYLLNVLRLKDGDYVLVFNGSDGEWLAKISSNGRRDCALQLMEKTREQTAANDLMYMFAPLKHARLDYMVQKAVEMGAGSLKPVMTQHTQASRVNLERMEANVIEAAEQCGVLSVAEVLAPQPLSDVLDVWTEAQPGRRLLFCDEAEGTNNPLLTLAQIKEAGPQPIAVLIGPEGGFSEDERDRLRNLDFVTPIPLGPRILRADTAAVAALTIIQATVGDWR